MHSFSIQSPLLIEQSPQRRQSTERRLPSPVGVNDRMKREIGATSGAAAVAAAEDVASQELSPVYMLSKKLER